MKNPLVICCILGILIGYLLGGEKYLTYGMVGGLLVGYLLDERNRSAAKKKSISATRHESIDVSEPTDKTPHSDVSAETNKPLPEQTPDYPIKTISANGTSVPRMNDEQVDDVVARAREEIAKNKEQNN
ncbi:MAG TPA: hypothetical protein PKJ76_01995 [Flexilinea sp.]|nr:hypothetical protein [Flexilinea sp.]HPS48178.1 hypothetical protein [Flexilinea sp.]